MNSIQSVHWPFPIKILFYIPIFVYNPSGYLLFRKPNACDIIRSQNLPTFILGITYWTQRSFPRRLRNHYTVPMDRSICQIPTIWNSPTLHVNINVLNSVINRLHHRAIFQPRSPWMFVSFVGFALAVLSRRPMKDDAGKVCGDSITKENSCRWDGKISCRHSSLELKRNEWFLLKAVYLLGFAVIRSMMKLFQMRVFTNKEIYEEVAYNSFHFTRWNELKMQIRLRLNSL